MKKNSSLVPRSFYHSVRCGNIFGYFILMTFFFLGFSNFQATENNSIHENNIISKQTLTESYQGEVFIRVSGNRAFALNYDSAGNFYYVTGDAVGNGVLKKRSPDGSISTIASFRGSFIGPGLEIDKDGFFIIPIGDSVIKVSPQGNITTLFSTTAMGIKQAIGLVLDDKSNIYIIDDRADKVFKVDSAYNSTVFIDNKLGSEIPFSLMDMCFDKDYKYVYLAESNLGRILRYPLNENGLPGEKKILYESKRYGLISNVAVDKDGKIIAVPNNGNKLIKISSEGVVEAELKGASGIIGSSYSKNILGENVLYIAGSNGIIKVDLNQTTSVGEVHEFLPEYQLEQNYPNPFNPTTTIKFSIQKDSRVRLDIYDSLGQLISTVLDKELLQGNHKVVFDGKKFSSGIYFYRLISNNYTETKKFMLIK